MKRAVVIPARYGSTRLPGKPLIPIKGKPLVQYAYEIASRTKADRVLVATDDKRILEVVRSFGGEAILTSPSHPSGTDRVAEVVRGMDLEVVINLQCDEPLLSPRYLDMLFDAFEDPRVQMATLVTSLSQQEWLDPNVVKVVRDREGFALYFSRSPIPYPRDGGGPKEGVYWRHVGVYAYRRETLLFLSSLPPSPIEEEEKLEQLRALYHGIKILTLECDHKSPSVDTEEDLRRVSELL